MLSFEDFTPGWTITTDAITVSLDDLVAFSSRFDAQDFHTDPEAAKASFVGELIGSGWHSAALMMRLMAHGFLLGSKAGGAPGIEELRWLKPVRPGDELRCRAEVVEARTSQSRPDYGLAKFRLTLLNQHDLPVMEQVNWILIGRRHLDMPRPVLRQDWPARYTPPDRTGAVLPPSAPVYPRPDHGGFIVGEERDLGSFTFTTDEILAFARPFDPQYFHLDAQAAAASPLGGLCASGWHTGAVWMMLMVADRKRRALAATGALKRLGPSPGFRSLRWLRPVMAGQTIRYVTRVTEKRPSASRPGWELMFHHNQGLDDTGQTVFAFDGCVFVEA